MTNWLTGLLPATKNVPSPSTRQRKPRITSNWLPCPFCNEPTRIVETRDNRRRRVCLSGTHSHYTREVFEGAEHMLLLEQRKERARQVLREKGWLA